eukprot:scaffold31396_cov72-Phaeocystis_antarctica.AAC.1
MVYFSAVFRQTPIYYIARDQACCRLAQLLLSATVRLHNTQSTLRHRLVSSRYVLDSSQRAGCRAHGTRLDMDTFEILRWHRVSRADAILQLERGQSVVPCEAVVHASRAQPLRLHPQRLEALDVVLTLRHRVDDAGEGVEVDVPTVGRLLKPGAKLERHSRVDAAKHQAVLGT